MHAPVNVAMSTTASTLHLSWANQSASASVRRPSASVLFTCRGKVLGVMVQPEPCACWQHVLEVQRTQCHSLYVAGACFVPAPPLKTSQASRDGKMREV